MLCACGGLPTRSAGPDAVAPGQDGTAALQDLAGADSGRPDATPDLPGKAPDRAGGDRSASGKHILGGFGAYSSSAMASVGGVGLGTVMDYISIASGLSTAHASLTTYSKQAAALGLTMVDDIPQQLIDRYHKDWNQTTLLADLTTHLKWLVANSSIRSGIVGYWMIDDWYTDFGTAKTALQSMTALIHQYTPEIPAICGLTGNTSYGGSVGGYTKFAANFSPQGCDMVGVYLYPWGSGKPPMTNLLNIVAALKNNGWSLAQTPLVGIPQSYGGANGYDIPTAAQVESETKFFCEQGATHILFYDFHTGTSAATSPAIQSGIKAGIAACKKIWGN
jgi:hypothetical protein